MNDHVSTHQMERFCVSALPEDELVVIARHLSDCDSCHQLLSATLRSMRGTEGVRFTLAPEFWLRHEHLDYEQLVGIAENTLDATDREIIDIHLSICTTCKEDVRSFLAFRQQIEPELSVRYGTGTEERVRPNRQPLSWRRGLARKSAYATAAIVFIASARNLC